MLTRRPLLAGLAALAACSAAPPAHAADALTVILDWLPNANHAALFAAEHIGAFSRQGLIVNLVAPSDPDLPARLVAAGQADLAISYGTQINMIDSAGLPLVRIATLIDSPLNTVMALGEGKIRTLADLKGGKVGISVSGVEDALLAVMLQSVGLQPDDVTSVKINYGMVAALLTGHLDAAIGAYRNAEVLQVQQLGKKPIVFLPEEHGVPVYDELILVARRNSLGDPKLKRFLAALQEGTVALLKSPDTLWTAFAAAHPELSNVLNEMSWKTTMPVIARTPARLDAQRYLNFQTFAVAHSIAKTTLPLDQFAVQLG